jgi:hypothetical protein
MKTRLPINDGVFWSADPVHLTSTIHVHRIIPASYHNKAAGSHSQTVIQKFTVGLDPRTITTNPAHPNSGRDARWIHFQNERALKRQGSFLDMAIFKN